MIRQEIYDNTDEVGGNTPNISTNGRLNGGSNHSTPFPIGGDFYLADPFIGQSGLLTVFRPTELNVGVQADAKPTAAPAGAMQSTLLEPLRKVTSSDLTVLAHLFQETHCLHSLRARVKPMSFE